MCRICDYKNVFEKLGIDYKKAVSLYKYAPVFKFKENNELYILKRTKKDEDRVNKLFQFEKLLKSSDIPVVTPICRRGVDHVLIDDERWVVYPFIEGEPYNASLEHIQKAGDLLGRIHNNSNNTFNHGFTWSIYSDSYFEEITSDLDTIKTKYDGIVTEDVLSNLEILINSIKSGKYEYLKDIKLPMIDGIWDYKASNLIYDNRYVTLVDLDNSGYIPRLFDLALALLLFNTESTLAPDRTFTVEEWHVFLSAYKEHVELSDIERESWQSYLRFVYTDEVLWAIVDLEKDEPVRQMTFMKNLLSFNFSDYNI